MPLRPLNREQTWLLPPTLDELVPADHPARFMAEVVDGLERTTWSEMGVDIEGKPLGSPAYHPRGLLSVWLYGFMTGVRSSRKLEAACRDQIPYLWLTGWQRPDHNTLWRFYRDHRRAMRTLLKRTVHTAVGMGLVDMAVQAVDGTKVMANAAKDRTYDAEQLERLLERTEVAISDLEAQNEGGDDAPPPRLPQELTRAQDLRQKVRAAMERFVDEEGLRRVNLTDGDAELMKSRQGIVTGYNAQAMVSPLDPDRAGASGLLITAAEVVNDPDDHARLIPMVDQAQDNTGEPAGKTLGDAGYHSGANLQACVERGQCVVMPESQDKAMTQPYHKDRFAYDNTADTYACPQGQRLHFAGIKRRRGRMPMRVYRARGAVCRGCPAFGLCTTDRRQGRALEIGPHEAVLRTHRAWMATEEAKAAYRQRKELAEPVFGIVKDQQGARRFLLRNLANVSAEWTMLATAFNLRTLWKVWASRLRPPPRFINGLGLGITITQGDTSGRRHAPQLHPEPTQ
jgi:transposase